MLQSLTALKFELELVTMNDGKAAASPTPMYCAGETTVPCWIRPDAEEVFSRYSSPFRAGTVSFLRCYLCAPRKRPYRAKIEFVTFKLPRALQ